MLAAVIMAAGVAATGADSARWLSGAYGPEEAAREYRLFVPADTGGSPAITRDTPAGAAAARPLFVVLHGCTQSVAAVAEATRFHEHAARLGFLALFPEQPAAAHPLKCWNWYDAAHQQRGAGEPALLAQLVRSVAAEHNVDGARVYVVGISAGALMAGILAAAYPEQFAGLGLHSGAMYAPAATLAAATALMAGTLPSVEERAAAAHAAMGAHARAHPVIVFHGTADPVVAVANARAAAHQWLLTGLRAAGGARAPAPEGERGVAGGYPYERVRWSAAGAPVELWLVEGLAHAWSGGAPGGSYSDPAGPDATRIIVEFLLAGGDR